MTELNTKRTTALIRILSFGIIAAFSLFPLFFKLPFRIHLDLPWEGTYRLYLGQTPYEDFGMPFGYGFFILPLAAFYIFGPTLKALLLGQVVMNVAGGLTFRALMLRAGLDERRTMLALLAFSLSYSFLYFWPWYNHTALVYQLAGLYFLFVALDQSKLVRLILFLSLSALFTFLVFFTKQDYGGLAFLFNVILLGYHALVHRGWKSIGIYIGSYAVIAACFILPLLPYDFGYWFNYGQPPHESRLSIAKILTNIMQESPWEKFYLLFLLVVFLMQIQAREFDWRDTRRNMFLLLVAGMVVQALITKTTSGNSLDNTTFFHGFGIGLLLFVIPERYFPGRLVTVLIMAAGIAFWYSADYWKYAGRILQSSAPAAHSDKPAEVPFQSTWKLSSMKVFEGVKLPEATLAGLERVRQDSVFNSGKPLKVLNMTELTQLALEWNYEPIRGLPLWYHKNVVFFDKQRDELCANIAALEYDLVMFEIVPALDNFFPEDVRKCLQQKYRLKDSFVAPRKEGDATIEVYVRP